MKPSSLSHIVRTRDPLSRLLVAAALVAGTLSACTSKPKEPEKTEPVVEAKEEPKPQPATTAAVTAFVGPDGSPDWLGMLLADHITRRLHVKVESGEAPLYVFGYRQAMSAARNIGAELGELESRSSDLLDELGADHLVIGSYRIDGAEAAIDWKIISADGAKTGDTTGAVTASARTAYDVGGKILAELVPSVKDSTPMTKLAAVGAGQAWGETLALLYKQSQDPRATVVISDDEVDGALELLEFVTTTNNDFAPAWAARATVASLAFEPEEEVMASATKAAVSIADADPSAAVSLYYMHQQLAEQTKAREQLERALQTYPGSLEVRNYLAQAYYLAGQYDKCLEVWTEYLGHVPKSPHAARRRDRMLSRLDRHEEAVKNAQALATEHPSSVPTLSALAERQIDAGKLEEAKATLTSALEKNPDHPLLLTRLSFVELEGGSTDEALVLAKKAVKLIGDGRGEPLAGYAHIDLARAQALSGDRKTARKTLREALRLGVGGDDIVRLANDPRLEGFITLPLELGPEK